MRDWLPRQARRRSLVSEQVLTRLELFGYQRVEVPPFEYADVLERGFGNSAEALRFVEPETGKIAALRSDVTPQIARLVSTRYPDGPWPARLCYRASVMRRRRERARLDQKVLQAGFELAGASEPSGDLEVLETATSALRATGLDDFTVDLAHAQIALALLDRLPAPARADALECLALKDSAELGRVGARGGLAARDLAALVALPELHGSDELWPRAERALAGTVAEAPMRSLQRIWFEAVAAELAPRFVVDLGETREFYYYTGVMFHLLAEGPGEPLGSGGRYDTLFERFDLPCPAAGFAFDVSNVCWALSERGVAEVPLDRVLVSGGTHQASTAVLRELRARGVACARGPEPSGSNLYAERWEYSHVLELSDGGASTAVLRRIETIEGICSAPHAAQEIEASDPARVAQVVATHLQVLEEH